MSAPAHQYLVRYYSQLTLASALESQVSKLAGGELRSLIEGEEGTPITLGIERFETVADIMGTRRSRRMVFPCSVLCRVCTDVCDIKIIWKNRISCFSFCCLHYFIQKMRPLICLLAYAHHTHQDVTIYRGVPKGKDDTSPKRDDDSDTRMQTDKSSKSQSPSFLTTSRQPEDTLGGDRFLGENDVDACVSNVARLRNIYSNTLGKKKQ